MRCKQALEEAHLEGHTMVMVGVDGEVGGAIELHAAVRPEVARHRQGAAGTGHQAYRDHLRRSRGPHPQAGRVAGDGPVLRAGPAR